jgi:anaerobic magnesium-protoporphyrin IX monomethyl ester cyclase
MVNYSENSGYKGEIVDCVARNLDASDTLNIVKKSDPKVVVVDTSTPSIVNDMKISDMIQKENPGTVVVLVGRHVTYAPKETLESCEHVKVVARGEFYNQVIQLIEGRSLEKIDGISHRENGRIVHNKNAELVSDVEKFGFLSKTYKEQLDIKYYFYSSIRNPYLMLQVGWGCPYNCSFCNEVVKNSYRHRSVEHVLDEIRYVKKELPRVKEIIWDDPTYVVDEDFIKRLSGAMVESGLRMKHSCMTRADISYDTLKAMSDAGFQTAHIGLESSDQKALEIVNKNAKFEEEVEYLERCKRLKIKNHACWIFGIPGDTKESIKATIERAKSLPSLDSVQCFPLIPTPFEDILGNESKGTVWKYLIDNNNLVTKDYSKWLKPNGLYNCIVTYPELTNTEIEQLVERFYKEFYFRPSYIFNKLVQSLTSYQELKRNMRGFRTMVKK